MLALKTVRQNYRPSREVLGLLEVFRSMVNECVRIGLQADASTLKRLSILSYRRLNGYGCPSYYKLCAISRAAGILAAREKSLRRGYPSRSPYAVRPQLVSCYGFKISHGRLVFPTRRGSRESIPLTPHTVSVLSQPDVRVRSFTLTRETLSLTIAREVPVLECVTTIGVDRNLRNLTCGNERVTVRQDLSETVRIAQTTRRIVASFRRDDARIRKRIASKYGRRRASRISQLLHRATKQVIAVAVERRAAIVLENIHGIRGLYQKGNMQGRRYRARMNAWSFAEAQRQIEYKARWAGLPVVRLSRRETQGTSVTCPRCGERLQEDRRLARKLWCGKCRWLMDRDKVAAVNIARRGRVRFARSQPMTWAQGGTVEAVKGNSTPTIIPGVDAPKPSLQPKT